MLRIGRARRSGPGCRRIVYLGVGRFEKYEGGEMATEYLQFAGALVFFLAILIGSYWFVYVPNRGDSNEDENG